MGTIELREKLHDYINDADETFLKMVFAMSKEYKTPLIIGYNTDGSPITQEDLKERVRSASNRVKSGDYITMKDIEKEVEFW